MSELDYFGFMLAGACEVRHVFGGREIMQLQWFLQGRVGACEVMTRLPSS